MVIVTGVQKVVPSGPKSKTAPIFPCGVLAVDGAIVIAVFVESAPDGTCTVALRSVDVVEPPAEPITLAVPEDVEPAPQEDNTKRLTASDARFKKYEKFSMGDAPKKFRAKCIRYPNAPHKVSDLSGCQAIYRTPEIMIFLTPSFLQIFLPFSPIKIDRFLQIFHHISFCNLASPAGTSFPSGIRAKVLRGLPTRFGNHVDTKTMPALLIT
jgi:hypothetical protein